MAGVLLVCVVLIDVVWTTLAVAGGRGPLTQIVGRGLWSLVRGSPHHRLLRVAGVLILVAVLVMWVLGMWAGWALMFNAADVSVVDASTKAPADVLEKVAYAAGAMAGAGAALAGLALFTVSISYLLQVVSAATQKRATAVHISGLGATPAAIVAAGAGQSSLGPVGSQITSLTAKVALTARQHLALPVLHYLHTSDRRAAIELAIARLDEALVIIDAGLRDDHRAITAPARLAITQYLETTGVPTAGVQPPPAPDLSPLLSHGIDVDAERLRRRIDDTTDRRIKLRALVEANGWDWQADVSDQAQSA